MKARIIGTGSYVPDDVMKNDDVAQLVDTNDEWIQDHTGIRERRVSRQGTVHMACEAAIKALANCEMNISDVDMILVATVTPDYSFPNTASLVQAQLGAKEVPCLDLSAACSGFLFAMNTANAYICSGMYRTILVVGAETLSKILDWSDRSTCILFGDGAGAVVMQAADTGIIASQMGSDGAKGMVLYREDVALKNPIVDQDSQYQKLQMNGSEVFKFAVRRIPDTINDTLKAAGMTADQIDYFILHQANRRIIEAAARRLGLPMDKIPVNIDRYGNIAAASIPILLDELNQSGKLRRGQYLMLSGFGAGLSWGSAVVQW